MSRLRLLCLMVMVLLMPVPHARAGVDGGGFLSKTLNGHNAVMMLVEPETGAIIDANEAALQFYGYGLGQLRAMRIQDINVLGPEEVAAERHRAKLEKRNYFVFPHRLANGQLRTVEVYSAPLQDDQGRVLLLSIIHDITGRAAGGDEMVAYRQRLEQLIAQRTGEAMAAQHRLWVWTVAGLVTQTILIIALAFAMVRRHAAARQVEREARTRRRAEEKLEIANADLQRFGEISAHHLQEPTRRLMVFAQRLRKQLGHPADEGVAFSLATIEEQASYLHALIRDVQVYLAASSPLGPMVGSDPAHIVEQIRSDQHARLEQAGAELVVEPLPPVAMDVPRLRYLLSALIDNCLRHAQAAEGRLRIRVSGEARGNRAVLRVADNGQGIPKEFRDRVLGVFEHLQATEDAVTPGTGLGLAVVRRIVESCDGQVTIEDSPLGGVQVVVDLPGDVL